MNILSLFRKKQGAGGIQPLVEQYVSKDAIIIDANAGAGNFTRLFASAAPQGHIYAFAPAKRLSKLVVREKLHNVSLFPMTIAEASRRCCPIVGTEKYATTLDQFAARHALKKVDFIHGDAQISVLHGARGIISKFRPVLLLATNDGGSIPEEIRSFFASLDYRIAAANGALLCIASERQAA